MAAAAAAAAPGDDTTWYFAIGSMINPRSLELRGLHPVESAPATIRDFRLRFVWRPGLPEAFADAQPAPGAKFDGVLHRMTAADMAALDTVEAGYKRVHATAVTYAGVEVACTVYSLPPDGREMEWWSEQGQEQQEPAHASSSSTAAAEPAPPQPPPVWRSVTTPPGADVSGAKLASERYIDLLVSGCAHFGVHQAHIDLLRAMPQARRRKPDEFDKLTVPDGVPTWRAEDVPALVDGKRAGLVNGKVIVWAGDTALPHFSLWKVATAGSPPHVELAFARLRFDVRYGTPATLTECTPEHRAHIEDLLVPWVREGRLAVVARVAEDDEAATSA
jgi:hypothetical protein